MVPRRVYPYGLLWFLISDHYASTFLPRLLPAKSFEVARSSEKLLVPLHTSISLFLSLLPSLRLSFCFYPRHTLLYLYVSVPLYRSGLLASNADADSFVPSSDAESPVSPFSPPLLRLESSFRHGPTLLSCGNGCPFVDLYQISRLDCRRRGGRMKGTLPCSATNRRLIRESSL